MNIKTLVLHALLSSLALSPPPSWAAENENAPSPGHSSHGEAFDEGPRQAARIMEGIGGPGFPVTTQNAEAQRFIDQGVGQLHGFWYWEAERSFRQAALLDPDCAMAYWGLAMANVNNDKRATAFIREAVKRQESTTPREKLYIECLSKYYESLDKANQNPAKQEAAKKKPEEATQPIEPPQTEPKPPEPKTPEVCEPADKQVNEGPSPEKQDAAQTTEAEQQREDALKKREEAVDAKERALQTQAQQAKKKEEDAEKKRLKRERLEARQKAWDKIVAEYPDDTHAAAFLVFQVWHDRGVVPITNYTPVDGLLDRIFAKEPQHPAHHYRIHLWDDRRPENAVTSAAQCGPAASGIAHMWHMPGHTYSKLNRIHDAVYQQEAAARVDHAYMRRDRIMPYQIHNYAHNNEWCIRNMSTIGRAQDALRLAKNLIEIPRHPKQNNARDNGTAGAFGRDRLYEVVTRFELWPEMIELATSHYLIEANIRETDEIRRRRYLGVAQAATDNASAAEEQIAWFEQLQAEVKPADKAEKKTDQKADEKADEKPPAQPAPPSGGKVRTKKEVEEVTRRCEEALRHIRGMLALQKEDYRGAVEHWKMVGNLPKEQLAWALSLAGDHDEAVKKAQEEANASPQSPVARAVLVAALWNKKDRDAAQREFETLRNLAATADLSLPAFVRLEAIAKELGYPTDWRNPLVPAKDLGPRPPLDQLGPLTWSSWTGEDWKLPDQTGREWSLAKDFDNQPVVVFFYLGHGCVHCVEQLNTFGPLAKDFTAAGIRLVAIGTDEVSLLHKSLDQATQGGFPFPILANPDGSLFKKYRCFDDFSNTPMHGTYLIDAQRQIRWQDVGAEPFTDAQFLLTEAQRLLSLPQSQQSADSVD